MVNFSQKWKGYAYARYKNIESANSAIGEMNCLEVCPKNYLEVKRSQDNRNIVLGIDIDGKDHVSLHKVSEIVGCNAKNITSYDSYEGLKNDEKVKVDNLVLRKLSSMSEGTMYFSVEYDTHRSALNARTALVSFTKMNGIDLTMEWAKMPRVSRHVATTRGVNNIVFNPM